jgi:excisionase family DNA binding protein
LNSFIVIDLHTFDSQLCTLLCRPLNTRASQEQQGEPVQTEIVPTWITYEEAQRLTSLGRTTLWRLVRAGEVKSASIGRAVRINRESLEEYMEEQSTADGPE